MVLSVLTRSLALRRSALSGARGFHASKVARSDHGHYHHLPFQFPGEKKFAFGVKLCAYLGVGFAIPFIASAYQLKKAGGSSD
ncbi:hypothetical protein GALMADRAFT_133240 [Galerina marginata CBS 339.88]|uniref:Cytochrome c oxidase subunit 8, mitochondrial n=1 Tax=Galerina marginata (strain CBS 339.88) TaxID=685588 RepID=A0A067TNC9_GALM3|nr:hypothetical protein GALMADRAFT_133240 [Galerina marginata CBS 339.88]